MTLLVVLLVLVGPWTLGALGPHGSVRSMASATRRHLCDGHIFC
jgi:hypothetical protein